jgi:hypothetical protein
VAKSNTASSVWADTAYRSKANEKTWPTMVCARRSIARCREASRCRNAPRQPTAASPRREPAVKHVFARQKGPMGLVVPAIGLVRTTTKIRLANLDYNHEADDLAGGDYARVSELEGMARASRRKSFRIDRKPIRNRLLADPPPKVQLLEVSKWRTGRQSVRYTLCRHELHPAVPSQTNKRYSIAHRPLECGVSIECRQS